MSSGGAPELADALDAFDAAWSACEARGGCDPIAGLEYRRVHREWLEHRHAIGDVEAFIRHRANVGPLPG